jgi:hypothetical protein
VVAALDETMGRVTSHPRPRSVSATPALPSLPEVAGLENRVTGWRVDLFCWAYAGWRNVKWGRFPFVGALLSLNTSVEFQIRSKSAYMRPKENHP